VSNQKENQVYTSIDQILAMDTAELVAIKQGEFHSKKLGLIPYTALDHIEYKQAKTDCVKIVQDDKAPGGVRIDMDEDKLMIRAIVSAVDKDKRSNFTFASKELLNKLQQADSNVISADQAVNKLLSPGEIYDFAVAIQNLSDLGVKAEAKTEEAAKN
jgi:hypothetical protein